MPALTIPKIQPKGHTGWYRNPNAQTERPAAYNRFREMAHSAHDARQSVTLSAGALPGKLTGDTILTIHRMNDETPTQPRMSTAYGMQIRL